VEVIGDPLDSLNAAGYNKLLLSVLSRVASRNQKQQCRDAVVAAYVSEFYLQQKYPPGGWSTHYSTIDLPDDAIIEEDELKEKIVFLKDVARGKKTLKICHAGTMETRYKAQDTLLKVVYICRSKGLDVELVLLGKGRFAAYYKSEAKRLGIEKYVKFLGMLPAGHAVREQLDLADMFVLPSTTEGLPRIVIEAMARGLPCIGSNVGGIPELLPKKYLVEPGNAKKFSEKIISLITNTDELEKMSSRNLRKAREYRWSELNKRRIEFYRKVTEETKNKKH
jgi:glycosyltransferase involved in cell wall biosynthesis